MIDHFIVPAQFASINERCQRGNGDRLSRRARGKDRVGVNAFGCAEFADAVAVSKCRLPILDNRDGHSGDTGLAAQRLNARVKRDRRGR